MSQIWLILSLCAFVQGSSSYSSRCSARSIELSLVSYRNGTHRHRFSEFDGLASDSSVHIERNRFTFVSMFTVSGRTWSENQHVTQVDRRFFSLSEVFSFVLEPTTINWPRFIKRLRKVTFNVWNYYLHTTPMSTLKMVESNYRSI